MPDGYVDVTDAPPVSLDEAKVILRVPHNIFDRLMKASQHYGFNTLEAYCSAKLVEGLETKVGATHIKGPEQLSGQQTKLVTGPSYDGTVRRA
jgi:hypothetical protein